MVKKYNLRDYHWDFIIMCVFSIYTFFYGFLFLYRESIYYNYIFLFLLGSLLGFKLARRISRKEGNNLK